MLEKAKSVVNFYKSCGISFSYENEPANKLAYKNHTQTNLKKANIDSAVTTRQNPYSQSNVYEKVSHNPPSNGTALKNDPPIGNDERTLITEQAKGLVKDCNSLEGLSLAMTRFAGCSFKVSAKHTMFYSGTSLQNQVLVIKDFPYSPEERTGNFLQGEEGEMIKKMFKAIGLTADDYTVLNTVFWRPPGERSLKKFEIEQCAPFVKKFIEILSPRAIFILGGTGAYSLFLDTKPVSKLRGKVFNYNGINTLISYSPKVLVKTPVLKKATYSDLLTFEKIINN